MTLLLWLLCAALLVVLAMGVALAFAVIRYRVIHSPYGVWCDEFSAWTRVHGGKDYVGTLTGALSYAHYCNATCAGTYRVKRYPGKKAT